MRPSFIDRYIEVTKEINSLKAEQSKLRPQVLTALEESGDQSDIGILLKTRTTWHEDLIYDWIANYYPDYLEDLTKKTVDLEKFGSYIKEKKIDSSSLPLEVSTETSIQEIRIKKEKKLE